MRGYGIEVVGKLASYAAAYIQIYTSMCTEIFPSRAFHVGNSLHRTILLRCGGNLPGGGGG